MHRARLTPMDDCDGPWICFPDTHDVGTPGDVLYTVDDFQFSIRNGVHPQLACALGDDDDHNNKVERFAMNERTAWLGLYSGKCLGSVAFIARELSKLEFPRLVLLAGSCLESRTPLVERDVCMCVHSR